MAPARRYRSVLLVCLGNICRSPMAEGILRTQLADRNWPLHVDSAGTAGYHLGAPPDPRAVQVCRTRGTPIDLLRARQVQPGDFERFDLILAADAENLRDLLRVRPRTCTAEIALLLEWSGVKCGSDVPDPYYGSRADFEYVHGLLAKACRGITARLTGVAECDPCTDSEDWLSPR